MADPETGSTIPITVGVHYSAPTQLISRIHRIGTKSAVYRPYNNDGGGTVPALKLGI